MRSPVTVDDSQAARERDAAAERADKLQKDLNFELVKNRRLEKDLRDVEEALRRQTSTRRRRRGSTDCAPCRQTAQRSSGRLDHFDAMRTCANRRAK